uniref:Putative basic tail protein n=1 Tax=Amblyomma cajennense TaxID=34607 RepID=A0A023FQ74_AMBCJ
MAILGLLCVFFLQALLASAETVPGCDPKEPENEIPVDSCDFYCGKNELGQWVMGYYVNGTKCKYTDTQDGLCAEIPGSEGCHPEDSYVVLNFLGHAPTADTMPPTPTTSKPSVPSKEQKKTQKAEVEENKEDKRNRDSETKRRKETKEDKETEG